MGEARASGGQKSQVGSSTNFYVFLHKIFEFHKYRSRARTVFFCAYTIEKQIEDSTGGLNPYNLPSAWVHQRVFPCPDNMESGGQVR